MPQHIGAVAGQSAVALHTVVVPAGHCTSDAHVADPCESSQQAFPPHSAGPLHPLAIPSHGVPFAAHSSDCGGVAVMAHPYGYDRKWVQWTDNDFAELKEMGVDGLEAWYPSFGEEGTLDLLGIAQKYGFCVSGGSDCHGFAPGQQSKLGCIRMPYRAVEQLKRAASTRAQVR